MTSAFFNEQDEASRVKADIVVRYFQAYAAIMARRSPQIGYIDLFAGPGSYDSGEKSTPLLILDAALSSPLLCDRLVTVFNDVNPVHVSRLKANIGSLDGVSRLRHAPEITNATAEDALVDIIRGRTPMPSLTFVDPWGYVDLSQRLVNAVTQNYGCEAIFFFNYNRINPAIENDLVESHMSGLFSEPRLKRLRRGLVGLSPAARERLVMRELGESIREAGSRYVIPFRFARQTGRTRHYICFVTKSELGYKIMKDVMANRGSVDIDGVPQFEYIPRVEGQQIQFDPDRPLSQLPASLMASFSDQTISVAEIVSRHHLGRPFIGRNYKKVLLQLEESGRVTCSRPASLRKKGTIANNVVVTFPRVE